MNDGGEYTDDDAPDAPPKKPTSKRQPAPVSPPKAKRPLAAVPPPSKAKTPAKKPPPPAPTKQRTLAVLPTPDKAPPKTPPTDPDDWRKSLKFNDEGNLTKDPGNAALILANESEWCGVVRYDEFADRILWCRRAPELSGLAQPDVGDQLASVGLTYVQHWMRRVKGPAFARDAIKFGLEAAAHANSMHPVREYLKSLRWDGKRRLPTWLARYFGAADNHYTHEVGRMWMVSAVARIMRPGCQADYMLVLEGGQGARKSSAVRALGGEWTLEGLPDVRDYPRAATAIQGKWIIEIPELDAIKGASVQTTKKFITMRVDSYRGAYAEFQRDAPRQCVYIGTTNEEQYLADPSGGRRYWPVKCGTIDREAIIRDRNQLWAEAFAAFEGGAEWHPSDRDATLLAALQSEQEERYQEDEWESQISAWLPGKESSGVTSSDILARCLGIEPAKWDRASQTRVGVAIRRLGWEPRRERSKLTGARERRYYPPESEAAE